MLCLYERGDKRRARIFAERLALVLASDRSHQGSIFAEECWSLIFEARGDLAKAVKHRKQEIEKIHRLHEISLDTAQRDDILELYGFDDLADRYDLLALLYQQQGNLAKARALLHESRSLAGRHGFPFDGQDILQEVEEEMAAKHQNGAAPRNGAKRLA